MSSQLQMTLRGFICLFMSFNLLIILCLPNAPYTLASALIGPTITPPGVSVTQWESTTTSFGAFILSAGVILALILFILGVLFSFHGLSHKSE